MTSTGSRLFSAIRASNVASSLFHADSVRLEPPFLKILCKSFKYNDVQKADSLNSVQVGDSPLDRDRSEEEPRLLLAQRVLPYRMIHLLETRLLTENDQRKSRPSSRATSVRLLMAACLVSTVYAGVARYRCFAVFVLLKMCELADAGRDCTRQLQVICAHFQRCALIARSTCCRTLGSKAVLTRLRVTPFINRRAAIVSCPITA